MSYDLADCVKPTTTVSIPDRFIMIGKTTKHQNPLMKGALLKTWVVGSFLFCYSIPSILRLTSVCKKTKKNKIALKTCNMQLSDYL